MSPDTCEKHLDVARDLAVIKSMLSAIQDRMMHHVDEGERPGGYRDRLIVAELEISTIKKGYWKACIVSGIIGGMLGNLTPDLINAVFKIVT